MAVPQKYASPSPVLTHQMWSFYVEFMSAIMEICQKIFTPQALPFKVNEIDTHQSAIDYFLLVFHSNYWPISCHFRDRWQYLPNFPTLCTFNWRGSHWNFVTQYGSKKLEWCPYQTIQKVWRCDHLNTHSTDIRRTVLVECIVSASIAWWCAIETESVTSMHKVH